MEALTGRQLHNRLSQAEQCGYVDEEGNRCKAVAKVSINDTNVPKKRCITHVSAIPARKGRIDKETLGILKSLGLL